MKCNQCGTNYEGNFCPNCGTPATNSEATQQVNNNQAPVQPTGKVKKPIYKKWWFWVIIAVVAIGVIANLGGNGDKTESGSSNTSQTASTNESDDSSKADTSAADNAKVTVADFSTMDQVAIQSWADTNKVICKFSEEYSDSVAKGDVVSQSKNAGKTVKEGTTIKVVVSLGKKPSTEYTNALKQAESYSKTLHMSKKGIYDQLTSEYGGKFPADAAKYAIDNVKADWNVNALEQAKSYQETLSMSKTAVYDQLISEYGGKFTKEEAQYAIDHLDD